MDCVICLDIWIEPQIGDCGHSVCCVCALSLASAPFGKKVCALCKRAVKWKPNYQLRDMATEDPRYAARMEKEGWIHSLESMKSYAKKKGMEVKFGEEKTLYGKFLLDLLRDILRTDLSYVRVQEALHQALAKSCSTDGSPGMDCFNHLLMTPGWQYRIKTPASWVQGQWRNNFFRVWR